MVFLKVFVAQALGVGRRINGRRDGLDFRAQFLLDTVQVEAVLVSHKIDAQAKVPETARAANAVEVGLGIFGEVEIDHNVHGLDVDATREEVRRNQTPASSVAEVMEDSVPVGLVHPGVDEEAGVTQLRDLLRKQLHPGDGVAKDDGLVDLQLGEQGVEAVNLRDATSNTNPVRKNTAAARLSTQARRYGGFRK